MKNKSFILFVVVSVLLISGIAMASAGQPKKAEEFKGTPAYDKLDLRFKQAWEESQGKGGDPDKVLECIIKLSHKPSNDERATLSAAGFNHRTVIGTIATGSVKAGSVPDVARLSFVQVMELAVPLSLKKRNP